MLQSLGRVLQQPQPLAAFQRQSAAHSKLVIASCERPDAVAAPARRVLLASLAAAAGSLLLQSPAAALNLRSQQSQVRPVEHECSTQDQAACSLLQARRAATAAWVFLCRGLTRQATSLPAWATA